MPKRILLINDLPGNQKVALAAMLPILSGMGHQVYNLPTALLSNTLDYGACEILDTTEYMARAILVWEELGFSFDAVSTGYLRSVRQAELVADYCAGLRRSGTLFFADPIMGDGGRLYLGITEEIVECMRRLISEADYIVPNYTEAAYLAKMPYREEGITRREAKELAGRLRDMGAGCVVITSLRIDGRDAVFVSDQGGREEQILPFQKVPGRFYGTGDRFSAVFAGKILEGKNAAESVRAAMADIEEQIGNGGLIRISPEKNIGEPE